MRRNSRLQATPPHCKEEEKKIGQRQEGLIKTHVGGEEKLAPACPAQNEFIALFLGGARVSGTLRLTVAVSMCCPSCR